jgi:tetratricopeptide (TPR) repeat protein
MTVSNSAEKLFYEALELQQNGRFDEAEHLYREALQLAPNRPSILSNLSVVLVGLGKFDEARRICDGMLETEPDSEEWLLILGACQNGLGDKEKALGSFDRAVHANPASVEAWNNRGNILLELNRPDSALESFTRALALDPNHTAALNNRGTALLELGRLHDALDSFDRALKGDPGHAVALNNRGTALLQLGQTREAMESFRLATVVQPNYARANWNEGLCRLALGDFQRGWEQYEWGWADDKRGAKVESPKPWWQGNRVNGTLFVWAEQGIGDQVLFSSMAPELVRCAEKVRIGVDARLVPLFKRSFPHLVVATKAEQLNDELFDAHIALGSIGRYLRKTLSDFPAGRMSYLVPDKQRALELRKRLSTGKLICGISWVSRNTTHAAQKSMRLRDLMPILALENLQAVDLQYGDTIEEREQLRKESGVDLTHINEIDNFNDIDGFAALIEACDVVVTVSNTTAHIAGAIGKPVLLLLPYSTGRHWYWHESFTTNPWYPSVRQFRQITSGDWVGAVNQVRKTIVGEYCPGQNV